MQDDRTRALEELTELKKEYAKMEGELAAYGACDPIKLEEKKRAVVLARTVGPREMFVRDMVRPRDQQVPYLVWNEQRHRGIEDSDPQR